MFRKKPSTPALIAQTFAISATVTASTFLGVIVGVKIVELTAQAANYVANKASQAYTAISRKMNDKKDNIINVDVV